VVRIEIFWDFANDPTNKVTISRPATGAVFSHTYPEFFTPFTQTRQVRVVAYSGDACFNQLTQTITLQATPEIQFDTIQPVCADVPTFSLNQATVINILPGNGVYSGRGVTSSGSFNPAAAGVGRHTIRYTYTGTNGCSTFKEMTAIVFPVPTANAGADRFVLEGGSVQIMGSGSGNGISFLWTPPAALNNRAVAQPMASPSDDITYRLLVTSSDGCTATDDVFVSVLKAPVIPNVFTPNGDGINDRWEIKYLESYPGASIEIFNRYGQKVYESIGYSRPWDGTVKGNPLPAGTYYYIINPKNGRKQMAGFVDILR
jgi:gliding motility-associated-like protein